MENDSLNPTTKQLLIQHFSEAAVFTDPGFAITACNPAAPALFQYNQQDIPGHFIAFPVPTSSTTNNQLFITNTTFSGGIVEYKDGTGKIKQLHTTRHAIAPGLGMKERTLMMGGRFEINSKPGEGTTIIVTTPLQADDIAKLKTDQ